MSSYEFPNEDDNQNIFYSPNTGDALKNYIKTANENSIYSEMPHPTEMHYIPHNNDNKITYNETYTDNIQYDDLQEDLKDLTNKSNEEVSKRTNKIRSQEQKIDRLQQSLELKENQVRNLGEEKDELQQKNAELENQIKDLIKKNSSLKDEAADYQSALGMATSCQLKDDDINHSVNLNKDILELNDIIKNYVTSLKQGVTVNMESVKKLLLDYGCPTEITDQKNDRLLIQAVLHRYVIETIFLYATQYLENPGNNSNIEADMIKSESLLSELLAHISKCRAGNDEVTHIGPIKLRQQVYSVLSNRGFANIIDTNGEREHPFVSYRKEQLNKVMNQLRFIKSDEKRADTEKLAAKIICEVVKIFWFRFKVQEPVVEFFWIPHNNKVDQKIMQIDQTNNDEEDENENLYVDLCYFPLIGKNIDKNDLKIYIRAKIITRKSKSQHIPQKQQQKQQQWQQQQKQQQKQQQNQEQQKKPSGGGIFSAVSRTFKLFR